MPASSAERRALIAHPREVIRDDERARLRARASGVRPAPSPSLVLIAFQSLASGRAVLADPARPPPPGRARAPARCAAACSRCPLLEQVVERLRDRCSSARRRGGAGRDAGRRRARAPPGRRRPGGSLRGQGEALRAGFLRERRARARPRPAPPPRSPARITTLSSVLRERVPDALDERRVVARHAAARRRRSRFDGVIVTMTPLVSSSSSAVSGRCTSSRLHHRRRRDHEDDQQDQEDVGQRRDVDLGHDVAACGATLPSAIGPPPGVDAPRSRAPLPMLQRGVDPLHARSGSSCRRRPPRCRRRGRARSRSAPRRCRPRPPRSRRCRRVAMAWNARMMPITVPKRPMNGADDADRAEDPEIRARALHLLELALVGDALELGERSPSARPRARRRRRGAPGCRGSVARRRARPASRRAPAAAPARR